jgi:hypothetical protein
MRKQRQRPYQWSRPERAQDTFRSVVVCLNLFETILDRLHFLLNRRSSTGDETLPLASLQPTFCSSSLRLVFPVGMYPVFAGTVPGGILGGSGVVGFAALGNCNA